MKIFKFFSSQIYNYIFSISLILVCFLPSPILYLFDGLPITSKWENIIVLIFIPVIFFLEFKQKNYNKKVFFIITLLILKFILIFSPNSGVDHKIYRLDKNNELIDKEFLKTFDSIWDRKISGKQKKNMERNI